MNAAEIEKAISDLETELQSKGADFHAIALALQKRAMACFEEAQALGEDEADD